MTLLLLVVFSELDAYPIWPLFIFSGGSCFTRLQELMTPLRGIYWAVSKVVSSQSNPYRLIRKVVSVASIYGCSVSLFLLWLTVMFMTNFCDLFALVLLYAA